MKHIKYEDSSSITVKVANDRVILIKINSVGGQPSKVSATWTGAGISGIAYGGFQNKKDFDFQTAASMAVENAISQARVA